MGAKVSRTDFEWVYTEEPHASRRKLILEKYPEIKQLFGHDPNFKWVVGFMVLLQLVSLPIVTRLSWPAMMLMSYCFGGVINHSLMIAIHEISHNMAFGNALPLANRWFGFFANLPIGIPASISFRKYHVEHHRYQGKEGFDPDLPTLLEAKLFNTTGGKFIWVLLQPLFYTIRPLVVRPKPPEPMEVINLVVQLFFDAVIVELFGYKFPFDTTLTNDDQPFEQCCQFRPVELLLVALQNVPHRPLVVRPKPPELIEVTNLVVQLFFDAVIVELFGWKTLFYLIAGSLMAMGVHPVAGHFVSEHYMFKKGFETYSYYGAMNFINFNVGYHMEHHDFPAIPGSKLPELKRIAAEFYDDLPHHTSWTGVLYDFIMDPDIGPYARIKRKQVGLDS